MATHYRAGIGEFSASRNDSDASRATILVLPIAARAAGNPPGISQRAGSRQIDSDPARPRVVRCAGDISVINDTAVDDRRWNDNGCGTLCAGGHRSGRRYGEGAAISRGVERDAMADKGRDRATAH